MRKLKLRQREMIYSGSCSWLRLETTSVWSLICSSALATITNILNEIILSSILSFLSQRLKCTFLIVSWLLISVALFLCYYSQEKFCNKLVIPMLIFPSLPILSLVHSNLPLFHPKSNPRKISVNVSSDSMLPNLLSFLCPCLIELSAAVNMKHFPFLSSVNHRLPIFLLPYRLFFLNFLFSLWCCSVVHSCLTLCAPWNAACQASLSFTISRSLLKLMSIESVMPSNHLILGRPLLLLPSNFPSIKVFSNRSALCIRWPKYWSFSISPYNEYSGLISFRIGWFDLLQPNGLSRVFSSTIVWRHQFFGAQPFSLSSSYIRTWLLENQSFDYRDLCRQSTVSAF